jgi:hypothetical protein
MVRTAYFAQKLRAVRRDYSHNFPAKEYYSLRRNIPFAKTDIAHNVNWFLARVGCVCLGGMTFSTRRLDKSSLGLNIFSSFEFSFRRLIYHIV